MKHFTTFYVTNCCKELNLQCKSSWIRLWKCSCGNQYFFLLFRNAVTFIKYHFDFPLLFSLLLLISLLDGWYHSRVFMDPVNGYLKSKLLVKVSLKSEIPFCWAYPRLIYFGVNLWQNIKGKRYQLAHCK